MNKLSFLIAGILLLLFINFHPAEIQSQQNKQNEPKVKSLDLSKKPYYEKIFTKSERKALKKANLNLDEAKKYVLEYKMNQKEIENSYTIAKSSGNPKTSSKSLSKAHKLEQKNIKTGNKSVECFNKGSEIKSNIYTTAINRARLNNNTSYSKAGNEFESLAKANYEKAKEKTKTAPAFDASVKLKALFEANDITEEAFAYQENAFAAYMKDPSINPDDAYFVPDTAITYHVVTPEKEDVVILDSIMFPEYKDIYDPVKDTNLYQLKVKEILKNLKLTKDEADKLKEASRQNEYANGLLKQVDDLYLKIDSLHFTADRTTDKKISESLNNNAAEIEQKAFNQLMKATNVYISVNNTRYKIYKSHFPKIDPKKMTEELEKAKKYEGEAEDNYLKSQEETTQAEKLNNNYSEQYILKMEANELLLYALQLQEQAYGIYFKIDVPIPPNTNPSDGKHKISDSKKPEIPSNDPKVSKWSISKSYTYSKEKPKEVPYKVKDGTVFLVQLGIFKGVLAPEKFENVQPVIYDEFVNNKSRRFMVGEYRTTEAVEAALSKIKNLGYADAYIIAIVDGKHKSYTEGKGSIGLSKNQYQQLKKSELTKISGIKTETEKPEDNNSIKNTTGLVYLVQLGMFKKPISDEDLKNLLPIYTDKIPGKGTRYMMGIYHSLSKARDEIQKAKDKGFADAYVIAYHNGEHISLDKAKSIEGKPTDIIKKAQIVYMIQVGAYKEKLNKTEENKLKSSYSPAKIEIRTADGKNLYLIGKYKSYKEADDLKKKLIKNGHEGIFVVAFNGEEKISVEEANKLNNK
jgi:cell division protein FtsN